MTRYVSDRNARACLDCGERYLPGPRGNTSRCPACFSAHERARVAPYQGSTFGHARETVRGQECALRLPGCTKWATTVDHIVPVIEGGTSDPSNLRPACSHCNSSRGGHGKVYSIETR